VLATLLTLPGYGLAGVVHSRSCQEQMSASNQAVLADDCCPGKTDQNGPCKRLGDGSPAPAGKKDTCSACKAGYNCKSPQSYEPSPGSGVLTFPVRPLVSADPPTLLLAHSPDGLWRPPRFT